MHAHHWALGEIVYDLHAPDAIRDPYPVYARMRAEQPVWQNPLSGSWAVVRHRDVQRVLDDPAFSNARLEELFARLPPENRADAEPLRPILEPRLLFTEGDRHRRIRRLALHGFTHDRIAGYAPLIDGVIASLLDALPIDEPFDAVANLTDLVPGLVILGILGIARERQLQLKAWTDDVYRWMGHAPGGIEGRTAATVRAVDGMRTLLREEIAARRASPTDDLLSVLVHARADGDLLDDDELIGNVIGLVNAGQETTSCLMATGLVRLLEAPDQLARLRADRSLLPSAVEEMLRFDAPAQFIARRVMAPAVIEGVALEPGAMVAVGLASANRDEAAFADADRFDVGRSPNHHLSFGHGPHYCIGNLLARRETEALLAALLDRFAEVRPAWDAAAGLAWRPTVSFRAPLTLPITVHP